MCVVPENKLNKNIKSDFHKLPDYSFKIKALVMMMTRLCCKMLHWSCNFYLDKCNFYQDSSPFFKIKVALMSKLEYETKHKFKP